MKTHFKTGLNSRRRRENGMAVIVVMALIAIVLIFIAGNLRTIRNLDRDIKLVEKAQNRRLQSVGSSTNTAARVNGINAQSASR